MCPFLCSTRRFIKKETSVACAIATQTENEGFDAHFRRPYRIEGNESFDPIKIGHWHRTWICGLSIVQQKNGHVHDANDTRPNDRL